MRLEWNDSEYKLSLTRDELTMVLGCIAETLAYVSDIDIEAFVGWDRRSIEKFQDDLILQRQRASDSRVKGELAVAGELARAKEELGNLKELSDSELITLFTELAIRRGIAIEEGNQHGDIRLLEQLGVIYQEIQSRGKGRTVDFIRLLHHEDEGVRLAAAEHTLHVLSREAEESLEQLVRQLHKARIAGVAELRLREWCEAR